jgi:hypothetical protein
VVVSAVVEQVVDVAVVVDEAVAPDVAAPEIIVMVAAEVVVGVLAMNAIRTSSSFFCSSIQSYKLLVSQLVNIIHRCCFPSSRPFTIKLDLCAIRPIVPDEM